MNNDITIGGLLLGLGALIGLALLAFGLLYVFAEGMSDAPQENQNAGCVFMVVGLALVVGCVFGLVW